MKKNDLLSNASVSFTSTEFALLSAAILNAGRSLRFRAPGVSMQPLVQDGDQLVVAPVEVEKIRVGDIILFTNESGRALVHRVIKYQTLDGVMNFLMQGDHASHPDGWISPPSILGKVTLIGRSGKVIRADGIMMTILSKIACWYSRKNPHGNQFAVNAYHLIRHLPILNKYLS